MIDPADLAEDVHRSAKNARAVRLVHLPTGTGTVSVDEHTIEANRARAWELLRDTLA